MKWVLWIAGGLVLVVGLMAMVGAMLPLAPSRGAAGAVQSRAGRSVCGSGGSAGLADGGSEVRRAGGAGRAAAAGGRRTRTARRSRTSCWRRGRRSGCRCGSRRRGCHSAARGRSTSRQPRAAARSCGWRRTAKSTTWYSGLWRDISSDIIAASKRICGIWAQSSDSRWRSRVDMGQELECTDAVGRAVAGG